MVLVPERGDPTLDAVNAALESEQKPYASKNIGFGLIGHECSRHIWYKINETKGELFNAETLRIFRSGHEAEAKMAEDLRRVDGITLYTHDPERDNKQYKFDFLDGRLTGRLDGVIVGLKQAPNPELWENKCTSDKKFDELLKIKNKVGEKESLKEWNPVYFSQIQLGMLAADLDRCYMTVVTPGLRRMTSIRTELDKPYAESLVAKAKRIINAKEPPERIGGPDWFQCRFCRFHGVCHGS